jgi:Fe-S cluster assembly protein SufD
MSGRELTGPARADAFAVAMATAFARAAADDAGRRAAFARFGALGLPGPRDEEWRFTDLAPLAGHDWILGRADGAAQAGAAELVRALPPFAHRLVLVNGVLAPSLSSLGGLPAGVTVTSLAAARRERPELRAELERDADGDDALAALNAAFAADGAFVHVGAGRRVGPLALLAVTTGAAPTMAHPRTVVLLGEGSEAELVEAHVGAPGAATFTNAVTAITVGPGARLRHCLLECAGDAAVLRARLDLRLERDSRAAATTATIGGALVRNDLRATLAGPGADCRLDGLYLATGRQHVDNHTTIDHAAPNGRSRELYKGILDGHATAVFDGKVLVAPVALKTDAVQANHNLLLSDDAVVNSKPQFNINADDVKCVHGAAIGQLREEEIFYLRTRGLTRAAARALLLYAFASEALGAVAAPAVRAHLEALVQAFMPTGQRLREAA